MGSKTELQKIIEEIVFKMIYGVDCDNEEKDKNILFDAIITAFQTEEYKKFPISLVFLLNEVMEYFYIDNMLAKNSMNAIKTYHIMNILTPVKKEGFINELERDSQGSFKM